MGINFAEQNKAGVSTNVSSTLLEPEGKETISQAKASWCPRPDWNYHHNALPRPAGGNRENPFHHPRQITQAWMLGTRGVLVAREQCVWEPRLARKRLERVHMGSWKGCKQRVKHEIGFCDPYTHFGWDTIRFRPLQKWNSMGVLAPPIPSRPPSQRFFVWLSQIPWKT